MTNDSDSRSVDVGSPPSRTEDGSELDTLVPRWDPRHSDSYSPGLT